MQETQVWSLVEELRSHKLQSNWAHILQLRPDTAKYILKKKKKGLIKKHEQDFDANVSFIQLQPRPLLT